MNIRYSLSHTLLTVSLLQRNELEAGMNEINLHSSQVLVLNELFDTDGQSQAELARRLNISPPTVNKMVTSLAKAGFVQQKKDKKDSRLLRVFLSKKGKEVMPEAIKKWQNLEKKIFRDFSETEKMMFSLLLEKMKKSYDLI